MFKKLKKFLFTTGLVVSLALSFGSCSQGAALLKTITLAPSNVAAVTGENASVAIVFNDYTTIPQTVDVYQDGQEEVFAAGVAVSTDSLALPTAALAEGAYKFYVKAEEIESNHITLTVTNKVTAAKKIVVSPAVTVTEGDSISMVIAFSNFEADPAKVDIYVDGKAEAFKKDIAVSNNGISFGSEGLSGNVSVYAKAGDTASNKCAVTLNKKVEVKKPSITLEGPAKVSLNGSTSCSFHAKYTIKDFASFDFNTKPKIYVYFDNKPINYLTFEPTSEIGTVSYSLNTKGKHQMYLALADSELKSNTVEFEIVESAIEPTLSVKKTKINTVTLTCDSTGATNYHFYCNTTNDFDTATRIYRTGNTYQPSCDYLIPAATETGKLYFWVRDSDEYNTANGLTSKPVEYEYTKETTISAAPTGVTVTKRQGVRNGLNVKWTEDPAVPYYYVYYTTSEDPSSSKNYLNTNSYNKNGFDVSLTSLETGTYYIWVKPYIYNYISENNPASMVAYKFTYEKPAVPAVTVTAAPDTVKNSATVSWTWDDAPYHKIYYSGVNDPSTARLAYTLDSTSKQAFYNVKLPTAGDHYFWVKAADNGTNTAKESDFGTAVKYTLASYDNTIPAPANVFVKNNPSSSASIQVSCGTVSGASYYWFYYSQSDDPKAVARYDYLSSSSTSVTKSINKSYFESGKEYNFWVKAAKGYGEFTSDASDFSTVVKFTPNPAN